MDIYYKNGSAVITEFGKKHSVISGYGLIDRRKPNPKPFNIEKIISNPRYVEIVLEQKGATTIIYPNKPRLDADDFPKNPPKPDNPPKTTGGANGGTIPGGKTGGTPPTTAAGSSQEPIVINKPTSAPRTLPDDAPVNRPTGGAVTKNISRGIILMQLVQLGLAARDISGLKADGEKFGYYVDPFFNKYVLTDPDKAAQNLPEDFELKFFPDPLDFHSTGNSITFQVKDGKFVNVDKNYPDYQLYIGADGLVTAGIIA